MAPSGSDQVYFVGVDVGTGSARAALVDSGGSVLKTAVQPIDTWSTPPSFEEQSSSNIWESCSLAVKVKKVCSGVPAERVRGIGFDATCSLVALDRNGDPVTVSLSGRDERNVILWMDHRAVAEADAVNRTGHAALRSVGGRISPEMQMPKLMWLKAYLRQPCWERAALFLDLPDFLTWRATGSERRSLCSLVCKWSYAARPDGPDGWDRGFLEQIGLADLEEDEFRRIGGEAAAPGAPCGHGLSARAAADLGLAPGTPVAASLIDAHAGALGMLGCAADGAGDGAPPAALQSRLAVVCGTSACHLALSAAPVFVPGTWGPYYGALLDGLWLSEAGQSAAGRLLDHIVESHPAAPRGQHARQRLAALLADLAAERRLPDAAPLTADLHVWPDFHGNRSPLADPTLRGMVSGLSLTSDERSLALLYLATVQALAYGTRHILEALKAAGHTDITSVVMCGGLCRDELYVQTHADVLGLPVLCPHEPESVLLGSAMLGACAAGAFPDLRAAVQAMAGGARLVRPTAATRAYHDKKYEVFLSMLRHQREYATIMHDE